MRKASCGFTLVELMIVVAIIGILSALALYGVSRYLKQSKTAEATANLGGIETGSRAQYQQEVPFNGDPNVFVHQFCPTTPLTPSPVPLGSKVVVPGAQWGQPGWTCLRFSINEPQYYSYQYGSNGGAGTAAAFTALATGDLDGNGTHSTFELTGHGGPMGDAVRDSLRILNEGE